jgi:predicted phage terminase large subunit-like protein
VTGPIDFDAYQEAIRTARTPDEIDGILALFAEELEEDYEAWAHYFFPQHFAYDLGAHHHELWRWVWAIEDGVRCEPHVDIFSRGGAKSTTAELAVAAVGARKRRRYVLYVCSKQDQADEHVQNIATLLESEPFATMYPDVGRPQVGKYGNRRGWHRTRLASESFTVDAVGLDTAMRGVKIDADRPDLLVIDDVDDATDSPKVTQRKVNRLTRSLLPTGAEHYTVLAIQNLVLANGVMARIAGIARDVESGELLSTATVCGPIPAVKNLELAQQQDDDGRVRWVIVGGEPTWPAGQSLARCQTQIGDWGKTAFLVEAQHEVHLRSGGMFRAFEWMARTRPDGTPLMVPAPFPPDDPEVVRIRMWDTAATEPTGDNDPDWTVGALMAVHRGRKVYRVEDVVRFRGAAGTVKNRIRQTAIADRERFGTGIWVGVEQEPGPHGRDRAYAWVHDTLAGFNAQKIRAAGSKPERAEGFAGAMENMLVEIPEHDWDGNPTWDLWVKDFLAELEAFTVEGTHDHDDQVDAASHGFNWLQAKLIHGAPASTSAAQMAGARIR